MQALKRSIIYSQQSFFLVTSAGGGAAEISYAYNEETNITTIENQKYFCNNQKLY